MAQLPGSSLPAIVQTALYFADPIGFIEDCGRRHGNAFTLETVIFGEEAAFAHPEAIKQIFTGDPDDLRAGEANEPLSPLLGTRSVLLLDGPEHLRQRRLLMPPFHGERMLAYARVMREIAEQAAARFPVGRPFSLHPHMQRITLDIILRTVFGVDEGPALAELRDALTRMLDRMGSPLGVLALAPRFRKSFFGLTPWDGFQSEAAHADALILCQIARRRAVRDRGDDILAMLLDARDEEGRSMTDVELRDELMTLLAAGHETTATALCWAFDLILADARVLDRLRAEIDGGGDPAKMEYLDATIKEALRHRPVIPAVGRKLHRTMEIGGYTVPAGMQVVPLIHLTHHLPDIYPEPQVFKPERFLGKKVDPYAFLPFGGGIRRCLGMAFALYELKVVLATLLSQLELRKARPEPARAVVRGLAIAPRGGTMVVMEGRRSRPARAARTGEAEARPA